MAYGVGVCFAAVARAMSMLLFFLSKGFMRVCKKPRAVSISILTPLEQ